MDFKDSRQVEEFANLFTGVAEYYEKELSPSGLKVLMLGLQRFQLSDIKRACSIHMQNPDNGQFMPKVADIVRIIDGDTGSQAGQGWIKADKALRIQGPYRDICFDDPIIHRVIDDMGGWVHFCTRSNSEEYKYQKLEFEKRYRSYAGKPLPEYPKLLTGMASHQNSVKGYSRRELPALIGDESKALGVYQQGISPTQKQNGQRADFARLIARMESGQKAEQKAISCQSIEQEAEDETDS